MPEPLSHISTCPFCGKPLRGRLDKKFCDVGCKNEYHNRFLRRERQEMTKIDQILKHNRRVLKTSLGSDSTRLVSCPELRRRGFQFDYYTHHYTTHRQHQYCFCYEYGYLELKEGRILIVRMDNK